MNMEKIINYYNEKYKEYDYMIDIIKEKSQEELEQSYKRAIQRDKREKEILDNGTTVYTIDFDYNLKEEVEQFVRDNDIFTIWQGKFEYMRGNDGRMVGVPIKFIKELEKKYKLKLSRKRNILGRKQLKDFKVGDKVLLTLDSLFGATKVQGTVYSIADDNITVRAYRSRTKGYVINIGEECNIEKISKFQKQVS